MRLRHVEAATSLRRERAEIEARHDVGAARGIRVARIVLLERGLLRRFIEAAQRHPAHDLTALAHHHNIDFLADRGEGHDARQVAAALDVLTVEAHDDILALDAGRLGRALLVDASYHGTALGAELQGFGGLVIQILDGDAEPGAAGLAEFAQLLDHRHGEIRGHREADADRATRRRNDRRVDADHVTGHVEKRTARIALVDGRIGLDEAVIGARADVALLGRDDARRHRAAEAERVADRHHPITHACLVAVAKLHRLERLVGFHAQNREIRLRVLAEHLGLELRTIIEHHEHVRGFGNDVVVGDHDAGGIDHETRAQRLRALVGLWALLRPARTLTVEEVVEEILKGRTRRHLGRRHIALCHTLGGLDVLFHWVAARDTRDVKRVAIAAIWRRDGLLNRSSR